MQKREIGRSGIFITPLMLGANVFGWTADQQASFAVLDAFVDQGGNAIDTADVYSAWAPGNEGGESERMIGAWLKHSGKRNRVIIGTKAGGWQKQLGLKRENIIAACEGSLQRLGVETIDLYWLHVDDKATPAEEYLGALDHLVKSGKVRAIGASNFKPGRFAEGLETSARLGLARFDAQQPEYHLLARGIEAELMPLCVREGVSLLPYYGLASGYLTGKYRNPSDSEGRARAARVSKFMEGKGPSVLEAMDAISARSGASLAQIALAWVMSKPAIGATIASATSVAQLTELMGALRLELAAEDIAQLDRVSA